MFFKRSEAYADITHPPVFVARAWSKLHRGVTAPLMPQCVLEHPRHKTFCHKLACNHHLTKQCFHVYQKLAFDFASNVAFVFLIIIATPVVSLFTAVEWLGNPLRYRENLGLIPGAGLAVLPIISKVKIKPKEQS